MSRKILRHTKRIAHHISVLLLVIALCAGAFAAESATTKDPRKIYHDQLSSRLVPLLSEVVQFPTVQGNTKAREQQQAWLKKVGTELGFTVRDAGLITEIELPGPPNAPVLGLMVHGDVQPVSEAEWATPPFRATVRDGWIHGRGVADDKGPLVQALLAMKAFAESGLTRTHTIRMLVGSDEESDNLDVKTYLETHTPPDYTLVLDSLFPVVVGEKAWVGFTQTASDPYQIRKGNSDAKFAITKLEAGLTASIVPDLATATLRWLPESEKGFQVAVSRLRQFKRDDGITFEVKPAGREVEVIVRGLAAHSGMDIEGGRNALLFLAKLLRGSVAPSGAADLLEFAREAGGDLHGAALGIVETDPIWGHDDVNVATIKPDGDGLKQTINVRHIPVISLDQLRSRLEQKVTEFNRNQGSNLVAGGFYGDEPLEFNLQSKIVKRLTADYVRATGEHPKPAISGGGTYAKRLPNSIAFGMWFPGKPYSGHTSKERVPIEDLHRGVDVLLVTLSDIATGPAMQKPFEP